MANLVSPGVQVSVTDESFYASAGPGTVPLIFLATKQDKATPDGGSIAPGTTKANAEKLYLVSSQRELLQTFGDPDFNEVGGTPQHGNALNEYGLLAAYSYLGLANRAYVVRADVDLAQLEASDVEPTSDPVANTHWTDLNTVVPGLFRWNGTSWVEATVVLFESTSPVYDLDVQPSSGFVNGDIILNNDDTASVLRYLQRLNGVWYEVGSSAWRTASSRDFQWSSHIQVPTVRSNAGGALVSGDLWLKTTTPNKGLDVTVKKWDAETRQFIETNDVVVSANHAAYFALPTVDATDIDAGTVVAFMDSGTAPLMGGTATMKLQVHNGSTITEANGTVQNPIVGAAPNVSINGTSIPLVAGDDIDDITLAINNASIANVVAFKSTLGRLIVVNNAGEDITVATPATAEATFTFTTNALKGLTNGQTEADYATFAAGTGHAAGNVITLSDGTTVLVDAIDPAFVLLVSQDETSYDGSPGTEGTFAPGLGYAALDTVTLTGGAIATIDAISATQRLIAAQDETAFDGVGANGTFAGGTGVGFEYVALDTITLSDGSVITVDAVDGNGVVTQFTVTTSGTTGYLTGATLTQVSTTSVAGAGFSITSDTANEVDKGDVTQFTVSNIGTANAAATRVQTSTTGTGTGFSLTTGTANRSYAGNVTEFTITAVGATYLAAGTVRTQSSTTGSGVGFTLTPTVANEVNRAGVSGISIVSGGSGYTTGGTFNITVASDSGFSGTPATITYTVLGGAINTAAVSVAGAGYTASLPATSVASADVPDSAASNGWTTVGLPAGTYSNFREVDNVFAYDASLVAPSLPPVDGTLWYNSSVVVDLLENDGTGNWTELASDLYIQSSEPTGVSAGDLWLDTDQIEDYPVIYRRNSTNNGWELVDNTDQTTPKGIIFADARQTANVPTSPVPGADATSTLDADRPDALLYPAGMLLWNTRASMRNVKVYRENYTFEGVEIGDVWVTESGNKQDGSPYMGQAAVKAVVVKRLAAVMSSSEEIRSDTIFYNLIATPGFPELIDEMLTLNVDRKETAFIIGDTPFHLSSSSTDMQNWAINANNAPSNGDEGLLTSNPYLGVYYPSGLSTNVDGSEVVVPASHMILRTMAYNDQVAYPWFAPAGFARGTVSNAVSVGYLTDEDEFQPVTLNEGQRDVLYTNNINPIAFIPGRGLVVYGQKTRNPVASALDRINVARLINYIRFQAEQLAQPFLFEPNDSITRGAVKNQFDTFLAELITLRGLYDFLVVCDESNNTPARIDRNELWVDIAIQPVKAVEFIYIPIRIRNTGEDLSV
jgi:hypothetical protein